MNGSLGPLSGFRRLRCVGFEIMTRSSSSVLSAEPRSDSLGEGLRVGVERSPPWLFSIRKNVDGGDDDLLLNLPDRRLSRELITPTSRIGDEVAALNLDERLGGGELGISVVGVSAAIFRLFLAETITSSSSSDPSS